MSVVTNTTASEAGDQEKDMTQQRPPMLKVLCPVEGKNGKTFWIRIGNAFINRDGSTNVYLNAYPTSGKLQIRPIDDGPPGHGPDMSAAQAHGDPARESLPF